MIAAPIIKKKIKIAVVAGILAVFLIFTAILGAMVTILGGILGSTTENNEGSAGTGKYKNLCPAVLSYENEVTQVAAQYGMSQYVALLLAQMQQESSGQGLDPMQSSESGYNTLYARYDSNGNKLPNTITDPHYSIECGVQELREALKLAGAKGPADITGIELALQIYNYGTGFYYGRSDGKWSGSKTWTQALADSYHSATGEGDPLYVQHVMQYYSADGSASGGITGGDAQKLIEVTNTIKGTTHYVLGGETPGQALDCSSYVCWAYTKAGIKNMPRVTAQGIYDNYCSPISKSQAKAGDIIFFKATYDCGETITHVGIYLGNGKMMHCSSSADAIVEGDCTTFYWTTHFYAFGRVK